MNPYRAFPEPLQLRPAPSRPGGVPHYVTTNTTGALGVFVDYELAPTPCDGCGATVANHRSTGGARNGYVQLGRRWDGGPARVLCSRCVTIDRS